MILYKNGLVLMDHVFSKMDFIVKDDIFYDIQPHIFEKTYPFDEIIDLNGQKVYPGLFDIHTHGLMGVDFNLSNKTEIENVLVHYKKQGVTSLYPTVMTDAKNVLKRQLKIISELAQIYPIIKGIHLEGPFLNPIYKGAMPEHNLMKPSIELFEELNLAAQHLIKIVTIAPELNHAVELISYLNAQGIKCSIGHSYATYQECLLGMNAGAKSFTHTFNAMRLTHQHEPGVMGAALLSDAYAEVICDGYHVHPHMVKLLYKTKGIEKVIAITDSMMAAGLGDGAFKLGQNSVLVRNGDATIKETGVRAGSTLLPLECLKNLSNYTGKSIEYAIDMMTVNPAKMLDLDQTHGKIKIGYAADFFIAS